MDEYCMGLHVGVDRAPLYLCRFDLVQFKAIQRHPGFQCTHIGMGSKADEVLPIRKDGGPRR